jgi:hypothetical protein
MKKLACAAFVACGILAGAAGEVLAQAQEGGRPTLPNFCMGWERVCLRTCVGGRDCSGECASRRAACNKTGNFHFNIPGPRRYSSCEDRGLVVSSSGKMFRDIPGWKCP